MGVELTKTFHDAATAGGDGAAAFVHELAVYAVQVSGIVEATITFEATVDGSEWVAVSAQNIATRDFSTTASANGIYLVQVSGFHQLRARISAYSSGTITVTGRGSARGTITLTDDVGGTVGQRFTVLALVRGDNIPADGAVIAGPANGKVLVHDVVVRFTGQGWGGPTNFLVGTDGVYGLSNGNDVSGYAGGSDLDPYFVLDSLNCTARSTVSPAIQGQTVSTPMVVEDGASVYIAGDDATGTGNVAAEVMLICERAEAGATLVAHDLNEEV